MEDLHFSKSYDTFFDSGLEFAIIIKTPLSIKFKYIDDLVGSRVKTFA